MPRDGLRANGVIGEFGERFVRTGLSVMAVGALAAGASGCSGSAEGAPLDRPTGIVSDEALPEAVPTISAVVPSETATPTASPETSADAETIEVRQKRIVATALSYVWGVGGDGKRVAGFKNNYDQKATVFVGLTSEQLELPENVSPETDCGVFVAMVMHESGADPNYPKRETNIQLDYLLANSQPHDPDRLYDKLTMVSLDELQPGDIAIYSRTTSEAYIEGKRAPENDEKVGHTYLVIASKGADGIWDNKQGKVNGSDDNPAASASWKDHGPKAVDIDLTYSDEGEQPFSVFRLRRVV